MEALGINVGYLIVQIVVILFVTILLVGAILWLLIRPLRRSQATLLATQPLEPNGVWIGRSFFGAADTIEIWQRGDEIVLKPKKGSQGAVP